MKNRLKETLEEIKENDYTLPERVNQQEITTVMLQNMGAVDPYLRSELIHNILSTFIQREKYSDQQLRNMLTSLMNKNYLFYRINTSKQEEDAVFRRSYSVLLMSPILSRHSSNAFLSEENIHRVWENLKKYMKQEQDHRGYVKGKGWVHTMAHAGKALNSLSACACITGEEVKGMLPIIREQFLIDRPYLFDEEEHMVTAIITMFDKIEKEEKVAWLWTFLYERENWKDPEEDLIINNGKHLLRALYFRLIDEEEEEICEVLLQILRELRTQEHY
ncbi:MULTISPECIES: DUF2785 domain-containing protein [Salimicrobium]|uniref:DUF2785 domain-containing protein n=2 Tax=Salimicrobium TaxID=351195 RepID=K2GMP9_9BACI|nr:MULTISPECIES: DUF2785 domain-containing protein [Salimicrobium]AKG04978.1 hypothetical protein AAV35_009295 [Salimicrobium jeotgali]EKE31659.1 hypothetical protein MJ3_07758 [Salimicrobium jeotgali]MBM7696481.1 hypothetical protein [Salimicrobium jeotgali]SDX45697.1 Protein of unknown function [Salimicrobium album]